MQDTQRGAELDPPSLTAAFGTLFLVSGVALLVYVFAGVSLALGLAIGLVVVVTAARIVWRTANDRQRARLAVAVTAGAVSGGIATGAYDLSRFLLINITGIQFWPFDIFEIFGRALLGPNTHGPAVALAGLGYHLLNGVAFGVAYTVWFGRRGIVAGVLFALGLEFLMVMVYPGWLNITRTSEFLSVSIVGHLVYGAVLGGTARFLLRRADARAAPPRT